MTDQFVITIVLSLIGFAGMIYIPLIVLLVKSQQSLHRVAGGAHREADRERRDMYDMLKRMVETSTVNPSMAMQQHATERMERMSLETSLMRDEVRNERPVPNGPSPQNYGGVTDDVTLSID